MPITRRQFDLGIDETIEATMQRMHAHLSVHRDQAYTSGELADLLDLPEALTLDVLEKLQLVGAIEARHVDSTDYYGYRRDLPPLH